MKLYDKIELFGIEHQVCNNGKYYLNCEDKSSNDFIFKFLHLSKKKFVNSFKKMYPSIEVDDNGEGSFPEFKTLEDLKLFIDFITVQHNPILVKDWKGKVSYCDEYLFPLEGYSFFLVDGKVKLIEK